MVGISCPCVAGPYSGIAKVFHQRAAQLSKKYSNDREDKDWPQFIQHSDVCSSLFKAVIDVEAKTIPRIFNAPRPQNSGPAGPVILYIEQGSYLDIETSRRSRSAPALDLALAADATVVLVDFNDPLEYPYPRPIHQVLRIYDWVKKNIAISEPSIHNTLPVSKIGVCGELVGGSLAAMLALTEQRVNAAAIGNPIVDWTALFTLDTDEAPVLSGDLVNNFQKDSLVEPAPTILKSLLTMREKLFTKAEKYHDPFASPLLFFRTPSSDLPSEFGQLDLESDLDTSHQTKEAVKKRRSLRKYPPRGSNLVLPHMRVDIGKENVLRNQGTELIELMRRSHSRADVERNTFQDVLPSRTFDVVERPGCGWWHKQEIQEIGSWFREVLRRPG